VDHLEQLVQQPVQRLGQHGQPAVVLEQLQARGQGFEFLFLLRADEQLVFQHLALARRHVAQRRDHANGIQVVVHLAHEILALHALTQQPGRCEVVLHHGHVTVGGLFVDLGLVVLDVLELDLVVLLGFGVDGRAGEGGIEGGFACRLVAITHQLHVQLRRHGSSALVDHLVLDADRVAAALERVGLDQLDPIDLIRFKAQGQLVLTLFELAFAGKAHGAFVRGQLAANQTSLGHVHAILAFIEQDKILFLVQQVRVVAELGMHQRTTFGIKAQLVQIGFNIDLLVNHGRRRRRHLARASRCSAGRRHGSRSSRGLARGDCIGLRKEGGLVAVVDLPLVPQQDHGEAKNHPEDGAADVVHEDFLDGGDKNRVNRRGASSGTGSWPPAHQG